MFGWFRRGQPTQPIADRFLGEVWIEGDGEFSQEIVGESHYQGAIAAVAGPKGDEAKDFQCRAFLICERNNAFDDNAVSVKIKNRTVGYLSRKVNYSYRTALSQISLRLPAASVDALIVGGWKNNRSEGHYGVQLDMIWPVRFVERVD
ncbi:MAG: hypothetical protein AAGA70_01855 [Pseudomonadota bacterium]